MMASDPASMKVYAISSYGPVTNLRVMDAARPVPGPRDLLVRVHAVAVNPVDLKMVGNFFGGPELTQPLIPGMDASGVVEAVGAHVTLFKSGDEVYMPGSITRPGSFAEYFLVDERLVGRKPTSLSHEDAAALPLTSITAWEMLVETFRIEIPADVGKEDVNRNKTLLVVGGGGGVGSITLQIAKRVLKIGTVVGTASRPESSAMVMEMGADGVIDHTKPLQPQLESLGVKGVDYIVYTSDNPDMDQFGQIINPLGKIVFILPIAKPIISFPIFAKRVSLFLENMLARAVFDCEQEKQGQILNRVAALVDERVLCSTARTRFPWDKLVDALAHQESGKAVGKSVLSVVF